MARSMLSSSEFLLRGSGASARAPVDQRELVVVCKRNGRDVCVPLHLPMLCLGGRSPGGEPTFEPTFKPILLEGLHDAP